MVKPLDTFKRQESALEVGEFLIDSNVWVKSDLEELYTLGVVKSIGENVLSVEVSGITKDYPFTDCLNFLYGYSAAEVDDLVKIPHSNSAIVSQLLRDRFLDDKIYTYAGNLLIALNPFKQIPNLYTNEIIDSYRKSDVSRGWPSDLPPHTFSIAQSALYGLQVDGVSQSCIVSGESGAGKTESAKQIMNYLNYSRATNNNGNAKDVQSLILGANPLLESLGNAKTIRNNNSSRFGRFIMLDVGKDGGLNGCKISTYMLELVRIEFQSENERNYHIFYQMLSYFSNDPSKMLLYGLNKLEYYKFLNSSGCYKIDGVDDQKDFLPIKNQLEKMYDREVDYFYKSLSAVLLAGNINFESKDDNLSITNMEDFNKLCDLLGLDPNKFKESIVTKKVVVNNETITSPCNQLQALISIRTIAKDIYNKLFALCIKTLNESIKFDVNKPWIGILDIYGFEFFKRNTFEQLLINYANERLQQHFIHQTFKSQIKEYESEGIDYSMIKFSDNSNVISVFDKPNLGIFSFLQEQCLIQTGTPSSFTASCNKHIKDNSYIVGKGNQLKFSIKHTAATVVYETDEFVDKNRHKLNADSLELLILSTNLIIKRAYSDVDPAAKGKFLANTFQLSMDQLMKTLSTTKSHFIRCIKSNEDKLPLKFDTKSILNQLVSLSVFDSIQSVHSGFATKDLFDDFLSKNKMLLRYNGGDKTEAIALFLESIGIFGTDYRIGKTKVFLRKNAWLALDVAYKKFAKSAKPLANYFKSFYKSYKLLKQLKNMPSNVIRLQSLYRKECHMRSQRGLIDTCNEFIGLTLILAFLNIDHTRSLLATRIQSVWRGYMVRKEIKKCKFGSIFLIARKLPIFKKNIRKRIECSAAIKIQSRWRGFVQARIWRCNRDILIANKSASIIQRSVRNYLYKKALNIIKFLSLHVIVIQANWRGYVARKSYSTVLFRMKFKKFQAEWLIKRIAKTILTICEIQDFKKSLSSLQRQIYNQSQKMLFMETLAATVYLQAVWRGYLIRVSNSLALKSRVISATRDKFKQYLLAEKDCARDIKGFNRIIVSFCGKEFKFIYPSGWSRFMDNVDLVSSGIYHTIIYKHPNLYSLGLNNGGCLGNTLKIATVPQKILSLTSPALKVVAISCGYSHTLILLNSGIVLGWGDNAYCQVYGTNGFVDKPSVIPLYNPIISISAGMYHNGVIDMAGNVYLWGKGSYLNLPYNISKPTLLPQFNKLLGTNFTRGDVEKIAIGDEIIYLLNSDHTLHSISKFGHYLVDLSYGFVGDDDANSGYVDNFFPYGKSVIVLSSGRLYHANYRRIIKNSPFTDAFKLVVNLTHVSTGFKEVIVATSEGELITIKEEGLVNKVKLDKPIYFLTNVSNCCTISATLII